MKEEEFGKKIASILDDSTLDKRIEDRLMYARTQALLKMKESQFIEVNENKNTIVLKSKLLENWSNNKILMFLVIGLMFLMLQQTLSYDPYDSEDSVQLFSQDYLSFSAQVNNEKEMFDKWKSNIDNMIDN